MPESTPIIQFLDYPQPPGPGRPRKYPTLRHAIHAQAVRGPGCWEWTGRCSSGGRGVVSVWYAGRSYTLQAARVSFVMAYGYEPDDVWHTCDNLACINPAHLTDKGRPVDKAGSMQGVRGVKHPASRYSAKVRAKAIHMFSVERKSRKDIAKALKCNRTTVSRWIYEAFPESFHEPAASKRVRRGADSP